MHKSSKPILPITRVVDPTRRLFRASGLSTAGLAILFGLSWQQRGTWPLIQGALISVSLCCSGAALLFTLRARALTAPTTIRSWMRPVAVAIVSFAVVIAVSTLWRWHA
jgi:hypothetical protein